MGKRTVASATQNVKAENGYDNTNVEVFVQIVKSLIAGVRIMKLSFLDFIIVRDIGVCLRRQWMQTQLGSNSLSESPTIIGSLF